MEVKNNLKLIFSYLKLNVKKEWQYKTSFFMQIFMMIVNNLFCIIQWLVVYQIIDNIGGFGFNETMMLFAISAGSYAFSHIFFNGIYNIKDFIYEGKLDVYLTQPKNLLINVSCSSTKISAWGDLMTSYIVLIIIGAPWWWFLVILPVCFFGGILLACVYITYTSFAFYIKGGNAVAVSVEGAIIKANHYPPAIFDIASKILLYSVIPAAFITFIPVSYIFLSFNLWWVLGFVGFVILWVIFAFTMFNRGLKKYNSGSLMGGRL